MSYDKARKKAYDRAHYLANRERIRAQNRAWAEAHPEAMASYSVRYRRLHPDKVNASRGAWHKRNPDYRKTWLKENPEKQWSYTKAWRARNRQAERAHYKVRYAVRVGKLIPQPCKTCGKNKSEAHHENYNRPLDVIWLCHQCHKALHHKRGG